VLDVNVPNVPRPATAAAVAAMAIDAAIRYAVRRWLVVVVVVCTSGLLAGPPSHRAAPGGTDPLSGPIRTVSASRPQEIGEKGP
jgi:hypothetical protein